MNKLVGLVFALFAATAVAAPRVVFNAENTFRVHGAVTARSMAALESWATDRVGAGARELNLVIDSFGGEVGAGMHAVAMLQAFQADGVTLRCVATGSAMSMAYILLTVCDERYAFSNTQLLWHPIRVCQLYACYTGIHALELSRALLSYEMPIQRWVLSRMGVRPAWFWYHWRHETVHRGEALAQKAPGYLTVVEAVDGVPVTELFWIRGAEQ